MSDLVESLVSELRTLIADLGKDGGLISPSVYDTAQVLRLCPPEEGVEPGLEWLLSQQHADGGWSDPAVPIARDVPTIAALLTLHTCQKNRQWETEIHAGLEFLSANSEHWQDVNIDAIAIAAELIVPYLIEEAGKAGLHIPGQAYGLLYRLRQEKLARLPQGMLAPGSAPTYSWEALGRDASSTVPDAIGSIGHSPAATAAWFMSLDEIIASSDPDAAQSCRHFLSQASLATRSGIPGVTPTVWPISSFEISYGVHCLDAHGLSHHPTLERVVSHKAEILYRIVLKHDGVSFNEVFEPEVDDTSLAVAILRSFGYDVGSDVVLKFLRGDHFVTFSGEINSSSLANAHALHALSHLNLENEQTKRFLLKRQNRTGNWLADKWHSSWRYTTLEVLRAIGDVGYQDQVGRALAAIADDQLADGGWGMSTTSTPVETAYGVMALQCIARTSRFFPEYQTALLRGVEWLKRFFTSNKTIPDRYWLGKELYSPYRVDRIYVLVALLSALLPLEQSSEQSVYVSTAPAVASH